MVVQKSERPGVFVGILRAGLGPFLQQAAGLLLPRSESTKVCPELSPMFLSMLHVLTCVSYCNRR